MATPTYDPDTTELDEGDNLFPATKSDYKYWCLMQGDSTIFQIKASAENNVYELKEIVWEKKKRFLRRVDAADLVVSTVTMKIGVEPPETLSKRFELLGANITVELHDTDRVSDCFPRNLDTNDLHIFVTPRSGVSISPSTSMNSVSTENTSVSGGSMEDNTANPTFQHTSERPKTEVDEKIMKFLDDHRPRMQELVKNAGDVTSLLQPWELDPSSDGELAKHIRQLRIPKVSGGQPSLLLHKLGEVVDDLDKDRHERIPRIFDADSHVVLINASGSGKTRLLLDGLCHRWGFYFVAKPDLTGIGSSDLWELMVELGGAKDYKRAKEKMVVNPTSGGAIEDLNQAAERRLAQLLLARFLLLKLLIEEVQRHAGKLTEENGFVYRRLWVLLQVQPNIFGDVQDDIFTSFPRLLRYRKLSELKHRIGEAYQQVKHILPRATCITGNIPFFCVLDEGQVTTTLRFGEFMSSDNTKEHPVMHAIWRFWTTVLKTWQMRLVVSGTGIELEALKDTVGWAYLKVSPYNLRHDIGAFDDPESHAEYIKRYVPAPWTNQNWAAFLDRAWAWFRGRYCSTAILVLLILEGGYQCPHRTIDEYVEAFTGFKPTDGKEWTSTEVQFPPPLATFHLINFREFVANLGQNWFGGDVEQNMVVYSKHPREHDFGPSRVQKSARLAHNYHVACTSNC